MTFTIRHMLAGDWPAVESIYQEGIETGNATFESTPPTWEEFDHGKVENPRLVAVRDDRVVGWAAAARTSSRCVYEGVIEHSVYVAAAERGHGTGRALLTAFLDAAEAAGIWTVQSGVFPENEASLALHRDLGFRTVGVRERVGKMEFGAYAGQWRDVVMIERRSTSAGTD
ncbi:MAG: N-acetyltransferase family protein [Microbacteriaceae bacterium]|nr:N-acetyltransferase family protein [Microbacteriaceae bacterium]